MQASKPKINVCNAISDRRKFSDYWNLNKKCYGRGDFFELRQVQNKCTWETKACKVFRKMDLMCLADKKLKSKVAASVEGAPQDVVKQRKI